MSTVYLCGVCQTVHDNDRPPCAQTFTLAMPTSSDPQVVGLEIRRLLLGLHRPGHTVEDERDGVHSHGTDEMRMRALSIAGICSLDNGEIAPGCGCGWTADGGVVRPTKENPYP